MNKKMLLDLAKHIEKGKLKHERWSFDCTSFGVWNPATKIRMFGGVLGEIPTVFPDDFALSYEGHLLYICFQEAFLATPEILGEYFDVWPFIIKHLFLPENQSIYVHGAIGKLSKDASREEVAKNMYKWVNDERNAKCTKKSVSVM